MSLTDLLDTVRPCTTSTKERDTALMPVASMKRSDRTILLLTSRLVVECQADVSWQWTKTGDESVAAAPAATFA